ncbi:magnesium transporter CorA family protein [Wenyingzhuangia sp. IMCC45467]
MIKIFKTFGKSYEINTLEKGCWINVTSPSAQEIQALTSTYNLPGDFVNDILDIDERSRVEFDDDWTLIILRISIESKNNNLPFYTIPLGIFITENFTMSICLENNDVLPIDQPSLFKGHSHKISDSTNFVLHLFLNSGRLYLRHLKQINQMTSLIEQDLEKSIKNKELNKLLKMEKCLVYFITALKANEIVLNRLRKNKTFATDINKELIDDAYIENRQALEMSKIYSNIQSGMMATFTSVISNNLNVVMKKLTLISIILMIPTLIASIFGMNIPNGFENVPLALPVIILISITLSIIGVFVFKKRQWI